MFANRRDPPATQQVSPSTPAVLTYRVVAQLLAVTANHRHRLDLRNETHRPSRGSQVGVFSVCAVSILVVRHALTSGRSCPWISKSTRSAKRSAGAGGTAP
ncbi:hypothetical protein ACN27F_28115 [Solwaraspora sp. WMMB335]|uniref:TY-Chap2 family putative peptide chaperone n=1 Tax=Solwaraspora sp. WMMB335 TaxID=3404118 RepID=UPI003B95D467